MSGSLCLSLLLSIYRRINGWYENSFCHRLAAKGANAFENSFVFKLACKESPRRYAAGSLLFKVIYGILSFIAVVAGKVYEGWAKASAGSVFCRVIGSSRIINLSFEWVLGAYFMVMLATPSQYWNNMLMLLAAVTLGLLLTLHILSGRAKGIAMRDIHPALLLFALLAVVSLAFTYKLGDSLRILSLLLSGILTAIITQATVTSVKKLHVVIGFLFAGLALSALYGLLQYRMGIEVRSDFVDLTYSAGLQRLFSTMDNPNNYAEVIILLLPLCVTTVFTAKNDWVRVLCLALLAPIVLALLLTGSRAAYLVAMAGAGVYVLLVNKRLVPFFLLLFVASVPFWPSFIMDRLMTIGKDSSSAFRLLIWTDALTLLRKNWVTGLGIGPAAFTNAFRVMADYKVATAMHSHNLYMQIWLEMGICALLTFLVYILTTAKKLLAAVTRPTKHTAHTHRLAAVAAGMVAFLCFGMVEYVWFYPRVMLTFWILAGLGTAIIRLAGGDQA